MFKRLVWQSEEWMNWCIWIVHTVFLQIHLFTETEMKNNFQILGEIIQYLINESAVDHRVAEIDVLGVYVLWRMRKLIQWRLRGMTSFSMFDDALGTSKLFSFFALDEKFCWNKTLSWNREHKLLKVLVVFNRKRVRRVLEFYKGPVTWWHVLQVGLFQGNAPGLSLILLWLDRTDLWKRTFLKLGSIRTALTSW